ncbi:MAG: EF-hand domain-containing protein [Chthoniobacteraceae bacterium]
MNTISIRAASVAVLAFAFAGCQTTQPDRFNQVDANRDRKLSVDEANTYIVSEAFEGRDANRDRKVTRQEWPVENAGQEKLFRERDTNRDGLVTLDEALAFGRQKGQAAELMAEADKDKDGYVSREEVAAYYASKEGSIR